MRKDSPGAVASALGSNGSFRGGSAPASLKPLRAGADGRLPDDRFPGRIRPGLIEAAMVHRTSRESASSFRGGSAPASLKQRDAHPDGHVRRVSGADPPRPH